MTAVSGVGTPTTIERLETPFYSEDVAQDLLQRAAVLIHEIDPDVSRVLAGYGLDVTLALEEASADDPDAEALAKNQAILVTLAAVIEVLRCVLVTTTLADQRLSHLGSDPTLN